MRRSTILLSTTAVLVLSAGLVVGRLSARLPATAISPPPTTRPVEHGREWLQDTLGLTPDEHQKMDAIWADVKQQMDKGGEHRRALDKDRDAKIKSLLTPEQSAAYDKIFQDYRTSRTDMDKDRDQLIRTANERSRALLTPDQQVKWDAMSKDMHDHHGPGGPQGRNHGGPGGPGGAGGGPSTRPDGFGATTGPV